MINFVSASVKMGKGVKIWHFADIGDDVVLGNDVMIAPHVHVDYGVTIGDNTRIQANAVIAYKSKIGKNVFIGPSVTFTNDPYPPSKHIEGIMVGDDAIIGAGANIMAGITIGRRSVVGMGSIVTRDVPDEVVVMGSPATIRRTRAEYDKNQKEWQKNTRS